jgi:hypothetical protein
LILGILGKIAWSPFEVSVFLRKTETSNALALAGLPKAEALDSNQSLNTN